MASPLAILSLFSKRPPTQLEPRRRDTRIQLLGRVGVELLKRVKSSSKPTGRRYVVFNKHREVSSFCFALADCALCSATTSTAPQELYSPFSDLPHELLLLIIDLVVASHSDSIGASQTSSHLLASCASTCKDWARIFQPILFQRLCIKSHHDLRTLLELLNSPTSKIRHYIQHLEMRETSDSDRWTHIAARQLRGHILSLHSVQQVFLSNGPSSGSTPALLPLSIHIISAFRTAFSTVTQFSLHGYRFQNLPVFIRLVAALPVLEILECVELSWGATVLERRNNPLSNSTLRAVHMRDCEDCWSLMWFFAGCRTRPKSEVRVDPSEVHVIVALARAMLPVDGLNCQEAGLECIDGAPHRPSRCIDLYFQPRP